MYFRNTEDPADFIWEKMPVTSTWSSEIMILVIYTAAYCVTELFSLPSNHFFCWKCKPKLSSTRGDEKLCSFKWYFWYLCLIWGRIGSWGCYYYYSCHLLVAINAICFYNAQMVWGNNVLKTTINCAKFYIPVQGCFTPFKTFLTVKLTLEGHFYNGVLFLSLILYSKTTARFHRHILRAVSASYIQLKQLKHSF